MDRPFRRIIFKASGPASRTFKKIGETTAETPNYP
jgi:hypothetical protein